MSRDKRSFFERLTGTVRLENEEHQPFEHTPQEVHHKSNDWIEEDTAEGQLTVDVYQTPSDIVIRTMVAGVRPDDLDISITRDMVTIKGSREAPREISDEQYFHKELYWGTFSRTVLLPEEIDVEESEATATNGLLTVRLPKVNKDKQTKLRVKASQ